MTGWRTFVAACAVLLGTTASLCAQNVDNAPAITPTTGTFVFTFTVMVKSTLPKNSILVCNATLSVSEAGPNIFQKAAGIGTVSGSTGTCKVTMPYSWFLATPTKDTVLLNVSVEEDYVLQVTASNGTAILTTPVQLNKIDENIGSIAVPLSGATTTEAVSATI